MLNEIESVKEVIKVFTEEHTTSIAQRSRRVPQTILYITVLFESQTENFFTYESCMGLVNLLSNIQDGHYMVSLYCDRRRLNLRRYEV